MFKWAALMFAIVFFVFLLTGYPVTPYLQNRTGNYYNTKVRSITALCVFVIGFADFSVVCMQNTTYFTILAVHCKFDALQCTQNQTRH